MNKTIKIITIMVLVVLNFPATFSASTLDLDIKGTAFDGILDWGIDTNYYDTLQDGNMAYMTFYYNVPVVPSQGYQLEGEEIKIDMPEQLTNTGIKIDEEHFEVETGSNIIVTFKDSVSQYENFGGYFTIESFVNLNEGDSKWSISFDNQIQALGTLSLAGDYGTNGIGKYVNNGYGTWVDGEWVYILPEDNTQVDYEIDVNPESLTFYDVKVNDIVPRSQEIISSTIKVYDENWNDITKQVDYEVTSNTLNIDFGDINERLHIKYSAKNLSNNEEYVSNVSMKSPGYTRDAYAIVERENGKDHWESIQ